MDAKTDIVAEEQRATELMLMTLFGVKCNLPAARCPRCRTKNTQYQPASKLCRACVQKACVREKNLVQQDLI